MQDIRSSYLDDFCGSPFWDTNLTWHTNDPELTSCFEKTVLAWVPCIFLWIFCGIEISSIKYSKKRNVPWSWVNLSKFLVTSFLAIITIVEIFSTFINLNTIYNVDIYSPLIKTFSLVLSAVILYYCRIYGIHTSGLLFLFWFLLALAGAPQFRSEIRLEQNGQVTKEKYMSHVIYLVYYPFVILMFLLNCVNDKPATETLYYKTANPSPQETASFLSRITYTWFNPIIFKGFKKPLIAEELWDINPQDCCKELVPKFEKHFMKALTKAQSANSFTQQSEEKYKPRSSRAEFKQSNKKKKIASVFTAVAKTFGLNYLFCTMLMVVQSLMTFVNPQILGLMISFAQKNEELWKGYFYATLLFGTGCMQSILQNIYSNKMDILGLRIKSVLISTIYKKALIISNSARREKTVGEIVNLMAVDAQRFTVLANHINMLWMAPLQIVVAIIFLWQQLGPSILAGVALMIILLPMNGIVTKKVQKLNISQMKTKDERVKVMSEVLNGMKVLKLYAWEPSFEKNVLNIRHKEIKLLKTYSYLISGLSFIWNCAPFMVSLATFATYVLIDENNVLDANKAFVSLSLFNILRAPLTSLPNLVTSMIQTIVSVKRINAFVNADNLDPDSVYHEPNKEYPLVIENGTFSWGEDPVLRDINLKLKAQHLTAVVGSVGAGKSSLISAFLGEMDKISGRVNTYGTMTYVSQQAWIQNATLKDNILFGKLYDADLYKKVIEACALKPDLEMLPGGDQTEIGEKGINLSGGQKQRVNLARAVYANAEIYLFDDPLSAVDSHVGKHIFEKVIGPKGLLKNKTKLLVTHGITYLPKTDHIIVIKNGEVSESGSYQQLLMKKGAFSEFLLQHIDENNIDDEELTEIKDQLTDTPLSEEVNSRLSRRSTKSTSIPNLIRNGSLSRQASKDSYDVGGHKNKPDKNSLKQKDATGTKLIETEKAETGNVKWDVFKYYLKSIGFMMLMLSLVLSIILQTLSVGTDIWLGIWADDTTTAEDTGRRNMYLIGYGLFGLGQVITTVSSNLLTTKATLDAAIKIHQFLLYNIMRLPLAFFDVTPTGRILGRFSSDIDCVDMRLPLTFSAISGIILRMLGTFIIICYTTWMFIVVIIVLGVIYVIMQRLYVATSRQLRRLESISRSPIYSHFGETVGGVDVIRAYGAQERFIIEAERKIDHNQTCIFPNITSQRWLSIRLEMIGNLIIFFTAVFLIQSKDIAPGLVGLTMSYALQITQILYFLVITTADVETNIVCVERIKEYGETPQEAPWDLPNKNPPKSWPDIGTVEFKDYGVRYRPGLDLVLSDINFNIRGGEKIGVVGRTGAGKSSVTLGLFRIIEAAKGQIIIDGVNIEEIGLHALRSKLTIIPQDAVLFSGSLRMNLDPFGNHHDDELWNSLEHANLKTFVKELPAGLQHEIAESGENLSVGQRQLICLARALLRKTKILILDEATAAVDLETDDLIQKTIRTEFNECTVITIAHRLNTILDSDRIIVLDKGKIAEFDTPLNLLANPNSLFSGMHKDAGMS